MDEARQAKTILEKTGVKGGVIVHLHCGDGRLTAALRANDRYVVHGLTTDPDAAAVARKRIQASGGYGPVSIDAFDGKHLPYADDLVNLIVVSGPSSVDREEILRVLCPQGVCVKDEVVRTKDEDAATLNPRPSAFSHQLLTKPWPKEIDQWSHFLHDASNNAVAQDSRVGPPRQIQWLCGPLWSRSHEFVSSVSAMVSAGGRVFYVVDEGLTSLTDVPLPERWTLIGRDAFNGVPLWKHSLPDWRDDVWKSNALRGRPAGVPRRLVADGDRLYVTFSHRAPLVELDAATGDTRRTFEGTENTQEIIVADRTLVLSTSEVTTRDKPRGAIVAVDAASGQTRWRVESNRYQPQSLAAAADRVVFTNQSETICLALDDGRQLWRSSAAEDDGATREPAAGNKRKTPRAETFILYDDLVLEGSSAGIVARSAETGKVLWKAAARGGSMRSMDLFVAQGCVWHAAEDGIVGFDLATGEPAKTIDPSCVQSDGHHLRCYRAKATEQFLITQFRGAEFVSLTGDNHAHNDWIRGPCRYGVMPANGLLYVPPNPCFCYPGAKLTGFMALAPRSGDQSIEEPRRNRLQVGPAYGQALDSGLSTLDSASDWPTYRHDARRSGATADAVAPDVSAIWQVQLDSRPTPPVAAAGRVYVAAKDQHTLYAFGMENGQEQWRFVAGGRIDSPPTVFGDLVLFGCADGCVYCVRATDGELAWRFRAAPIDRRIVAFGQLESAWRVHGSILLDDDIAYCTAGRSTFLDGGIWVYGLKPDTGEVLHETQLDTWSPTRQDAAGKPFIPSYHIEGAHSDILVAQNDHIYLGQYKLDRTLEIQPAPYNMRDPDKPVVAMDIKDTPFTASDPDLEQGFESFRGFHRYMERAHPALSERFKARYGGMNMGDRRTGKHLAATAGFLDDTWFNRTFWMYSDSWPGWYHGHRGAKSGQLLVMGAERTYAVQAFPTRNRQSPLFKPGEKGYLLIADDNDNEPVLDDLTRGATKGMGYTRLAAPAWFDWVPIRIRGMVEAGNLLFVAGPPDIVPAEDPMAAFEGRKGALIRGISSADGRTQSEVRLDSLPVFDGLIAAGGRLFLSTEDHRLICLAEAEAERS